MTPSADQLKRAAAQRALEFVQDGMVLGLGSGSTAELFIVALAARVRAGLRVVGIPTSRRVDRLARQLGLPLGSLDEHAFVDLTIDGADEIDPRTFNLIKGRGGSLLREKLVAIASKRLTIVADESKLVTTLGERQPVPVEIVRFGWQGTAASLRGLDCEVRLRETEGNPVISDEGHYILDCRFSPISQPEKLAREIKAIIGVVEHGLFIGLTHQLVIGTSGGVKLYE